ncbi:MAG: hypothetical protein JST00_35735 [Deltaproteobacteria bacterium]|nr:hypothetical protein [Deltaproteobacteria bacterium]
MTVMRPAALAAGLAILVAVPSAGAAPEAPPAPPAAAARIFDAYGPTFPLAISVAAKDGSLAADDAWIAAQIDAANDLFGPIGIHFRWLLRKEIAPAHFEMHSRADRDALAALVEKNAIDVFVVSQLEDVDEPGRMRKGVAWTAKAAGKRYLILSAAAPRGVLTHELGHFFGNAHTDVPDNLMSYSRTESGTVFLDDAQIARSRELALHFLSSGRLPDAGPPRRLR